MMTATMEQRLKLGAVQREPKRTAATLGGVAAGGALKDGLITFQVTVHSQEHYCYSD